MSAPTVKRWNLGRRTLTFERRPLVMGILNVTPDSFSDGGKHEGVDSAVEAAKQMQADGADIIDIGGESTRPYSDPVAVTDELERVIPVIRRLSDQLSIPISIDTSKAAVAKAAIDCGAEIINDVSGLEGDPAMTPLAAHSEVGVCVMHMRGTPQTMQDSPAYDNVVEDIMAYLKDRFEFCIAAGIDGSRVCLDPGIGFGKTHEHNLELLRSTSRFCELDAPILIGHSRKGFVGKLLGDKTADRDAGTLGVTLAVAEAGADIVRVHNVKLTVDALKLFSACRGNRQ